MENSALSGSEDYNVFSDNDYGTPGKLQIFTVAASSGLKIRHQKRVDAAGTFVKNHFSIPETAVHAAL